MAEILETDICVIGGGSAGLSVAAGAAQMGAETVLVQEGKMGGDCLNYGCVPSKALLAAGKAANGNSHAAELGISLGSPAIDFAAVHDHVHDVISAIAPHDSVERFEGLGVTVIKAVARFVGPREIEAGGRRIQARRFVIATGSSPAVPPIPGLADAPVYTNETIFDLTERPRHLIVIGGGPIGCELSQAFRDLGAEVSVVELDRILPKDDPELVSVLRTELQSRGVRLFEQTKASGVEKTGDGVRLLIERNGTSDRIEGDAILVAVGRKPTVNQLNLNAAGVEYDDKGIKVDARLRTTNPKIYAAGDVVGRHQFTHMANHHAGIVIRNCLFRLPAKVDTRAMPWVTYTDPELAHVGLTEQEARKEAGEVRVLRWPFVDNDRAQTERRTRGLVKAVTTPRGKILGASIVGAHAGELIHLWVLAISKGIGIGAIARMIAPYPTFGEANKGAAGSFYTPKLFSARTRKLVRFLARFG